MKVKTPLAETAGFDTPAKLCKFTGLIRMDLPNIKYYDWHIEIAMTNCKFLDVVNE